MNKIKTLTISFCFLLVSISTKAAPSHFEELIQFGQNTIQCGPSTFTSMFTLSENNFYYDCLEREFKITYFQTTSDYMKCTGYTFRVYSQYYGGSPVLETSGYFGNNIFSLPPTISGNFKIQRHQDEENYKYFIELSFQNPSGCQNWGIACGYPVYETSPLFTPNWDALPQVSERPFSLDNLTSEATQFNFETKCDGDAMNFSLTQEVVDDLNCTVSNGVGGNIPCANQYAGLKITKVDANLNPVDNHKYIGTQEWINSLSLPSGYPDIIIEDFIDPSGNTEVIPLLPLFGNYMTNNFGYYELEFTYASLCGDYIETMLIEYTPTSLPIVDILVPNANFGWEALEIPSNNSETNPIYSACSFSGGFIFNPIASNIYGNVLSYEIFMERLDPSGYVTILNNVPLSWTSLTTATNGVSFNGLIYTFGNPSDGISPGSTNSTKIHHVRLKYSTDCGDSFQDFWFYPSATTCKKEIDVSWFFEDYTNVENINLFPSLADDKIYIKWVNNDFNFTNGTIYNSNGKLVKRFSIYKETVGVKKINLSVSELDKGLYYVNLEGLNNVKNLKFIKK